MNNLSKYFKLSKYINFIKKYPRIQNLAKLNNKYLRLILIEFYSYFVRKNKNLKYFFFENSEEVNNIYFDPNDLEEQKNELFASLSQNGIIIIRNAVNDEEIKLISNYFEEIKNKKIVSDWIGKEIVDASAVKYRNAKKNIEISYLRKDMKYLPTLNKLNQILTKKIFGKPINTSAEFFIHNCMYKEENDKTYEDTNFHMDRYLPCLKIIYSPNEILSIDAPFGYIKKSHKMNNEFMKNFILNSKNFTIYNDQLTEEQKKNIINTACSPNSLIVTFANGLHKRNIFLENNRVRKTIFFQFTESFNSLSLFDFKKFNSQN